MTSTKPREWFLVHRLGHTEGWIYNHLDAAEKRLSSGIKRPDFAEECKIIHVIEHSAYQALEKRCEELEKKVKAREMSLVYVNDDWNKVYKELESEWFAYKRAVAELLPFAQKARGLLGPDDRTELVQTIDKAKRLLDGDKGEM